LKVKKNIYISFDYELFFGAKSGSVEKCLLEPTARLMDLAEKHGVRFVFFVDAGYLWQLKNHDAVESCRFDLDRIATQLRQLCSKGHEIALHVHPHWEDSFFQEGSWQIKTKRYKHADFDDAEVEKIVSKYHKILTDVVGKPCKSFRAGGWCIQPFPNIKKALELNNIFTDSSVYKNGYHRFSAQSYDFRDAPDKSRWQFEDDVCIENKSGKFTEVAISADRVPPTFFMELYLKMKLNPAEYKPIGDGSWLKDKKKIYKQFYTFTRHFACCDGYFASRLIGILKRLQQSDKMEMLVLGHPKSLANCSFRYLDNFISFSKKNGFSITVLNENC
jgi:hypothetical protein